MTMAMLSSLAFLCRFQNKVYVVYGKEGVQCCLYLTYINLYHEACTPDFLILQSERYCELCELVPAEWYFRH